MLSRNELQTPVPNPLPGFVAQAMHCAAHRVQVVLRRDRQCVAVKAGRQGELPRGSVTLAASSTCAPPCSKIVVAQHALHMLAPVRCRSGLVTQGTTGISLQGEHPVH